MEVRRALLEERGRRFARRSTVDVRADAERVLVATIGANLYGLRLADVAKVRPLETWGSAVASHPALLGMVSDGGQLQPLLDLATLLGGEPAPASRGWMIILSRSLRAALRVADLPIAADVEPLPDEAPERMRVLDGPQQGRILVRLSAPALFERLSQPQGVHAS